MLPVYKPNDRIFVSSIPYLLNEPKKGDVILFKNKGKPFVKRIVKIRNKKIEVIGDNMQDSLSVTPIENTMIVGKVIAKI